MITQLLREIKFISEVAGLVMKEAIARTPPDTGVTPVVKFCSVPETGWALRLIYWIGEERHSHIATVGLAKFNQLSPQQVAIDFLTAIEHFAGSTLNENDSPDRWDVDAISTLAGWVMQSSLERFWIYQDPPLIKQCAAISFCSMPLSSAWSIYLTWEPVDGEEKQASQSFDRTTLFRLKSTAKFSQLAETTLTQWGIPQRQTPSTTMPFTPQPIPKFHQVESGKLNRFYS